MRNGRRGKFLSLTQRARRGGEEKVAGVLYASHRAHRGHGGGRLTAREGTEGELRSIERAQRSQEGMEVSEGSERKRKKSALQMLILHGAGLQILLNGATHERKASHRGHGGTEFFRTQRRADALAERAQRGCGEGAECHRRCQSRRRSREAH